MKKQGNGIKKQVRKSEGGTKESLSYTVIVTDKEGHVLQRISAPSRSYVQQWNQLLNVNAKATALTVKDTIGVDRNAVWYFGLFWANAAAGVDERGIRVGRGSTPVAITGYAIETPCDEGIGANQLNHLATSFTTPSVAGSTCSFTMKRTMINNSGATITGIRELGCYVRFKYSPAVYTHALGFRDVLPSAVYVPHGGSITVTYTIKVTV